MNKLIAEFEAVQRDDLTSGCRDEFIAIIREAFEGRLSCGTLKQIMAEYSAAKDDDSWDRGHPIFQMAAEIDQLKKNAAAIAEIVWSEEVEDAYGALNSIQRYC